MPNLTAVTPLILTYNEAPNIERALVDVCWAERVVVVDSGSDDGTREIVESCGNTALYTRDFDRHEHQWNYGLDQVATPWVLALDADYRVSEALVEEIEGVGDPSENGFYAHFHYRVLDRTLTRSLYPPRQVLFRREKAVFERAGHTQRVCVEGSSSELSTPLVHDDRKPLRRWVNNQLRYARLEAERLKHAPSSGLDFVDRLRATRVLGPPAVFLYCLLGKALVLEGWPGWYYTLERTVAELLLSMTLLRRDVGLAEDGRADG